MDFLPSLLNFENLDDLQLHFPSLFPDQQEIFHENRLLSSPTALSKLHSSPHHDNNLIRKAESCKGRRSSAVTLDHGEDTNINNIDQNKKRKLLHRNVERQRRQDMSKLYGSLRAALPSHCLKGFAYAIGQGKRSITDHMDEAVKHIQLKQKKIEDLKKRRNKLTDQLMSTSPSSVISPNGYISVSAGDESGDHCVTVNGCKDLGMEVIVNSPMKSGGQFRLSRILNVLIDQGLTILCCISSKANHRMIHTIESEVSDGRSIEPTELQQRLTDLVSKILIFDQHLN